MERAADPKYTARFRVLVVSFQGFKPQDEAMCDALAEWTAEGGQLVILDEGDDPLSKEEAFWWRKKGFRSPTAALFAEVNRPSGDAVDWKHGKGSVHYAKDLTAAGCADAARAESEYVPLVKAALTRAGISEWKRPGYFCMRRGDYVIAQAEAQPLHLDGKYLDVFSPELAIRDGIDLAPGESGLYKDVTAKIAEDAPAGVLHTTYRLLSQEVTGRNLCFTVKGPKDTDLVARVHTGGRPCEITAAAVDGSTVPVKTAGAGDTLLIQCPNNVKGITITLTR